MTIVAGDILRTTCNFVLADGTLYQNVYHHKRSGVAVISDAAHVTALESWAEMMYGEVVGITKNDVVEQLSYVDQVEWSVDEWVIVDNLGTFLITFTPNVADHALPNQMSPFIVFKTARPKTVGRKFLFPCTEVAQEAGILTPGVIAALVAFADDAVNDIELAALNYLVPGVPRTAVNEWQEFTVAIVTNLMGTQRRRRPGYGA